VIKLSFWDPAILAVLAFLTLALTGCDDDLTCDYCHVPRTYTYRNLCDKCGSSHLCCQNERPLWHFENEKVVAIKICPNPEQAVKVGGTESGGTQKGKEEIVVRYVEEFGSKKVLGAMVLGIALAFLFGYKWGRQDERLKAKA
jgi:hypothetical protein